MVDFRFFDHIVRLGRVRVMGVMGGMAVYLGESVSQSDSHTRGGRGRGWKMVEGDAIGGSTKPRMLAE